LDLAFDLVIGSRSLREARALPQGIYHMSCLQALDPARAIRGEEIACH
jgi:hypothetical protein